MGSARGMTHRWVDVGGLRLHFVEAGTGPLVVLLHGFPEFLCHSLAFPSTSSGVRPRVQRPVWARSVL